MPPSEEWTVGRLLNWTTDYLAAHTVESPRLEAEILLAEALGCERIQLYVGFAQAPTEAQRGRFRELVRRRAEGAPVAYLVGRKEFFSLSFQVTPDVLIPRPETELLVITLLDLARAQAREGRPPPTIADVGVGSGAIAVAVAKHLPGCRVVASDLSPGALAVARANAATHGVAEQIEFIECDLLQGVPAEESPFDFIVSNPPYISEAELATIDRQVRDHEPRQALLAGPRGTEVIERLLPQAADRLRGGGHLLLELSPMIEAAVGKLMAADPRWEPLPTVHDLAQLPRVAHAQRREL